MRRPEAPAALLALVLLLPSAAAQPTTVTASSDDCVTQLLVVWGPHIPGACSASLSETLDVRCAATCTVTFAGEVTGTSAVPTGAGVFGWVVQGNVAPCVYTVGLFAQGLPPCGPGSQYAYLCFAVTELAGSASCSGTLQVAFATPAGGCTSFIVGATGHSRLRAPPSPSPPPFTVLVYDSAFAQAPYRLERAPDGTPALLPGFC